MAKTYLFFVVVLSRTKNINFHRVVLKSKMTDFYTKQALLKIKNKNKKTKTKTKQRQEMLSKPAVSS